VGHYIIDIDTKQFTQLRLLYLNGNNRSLRYLRNTVSSFKVKRPTLDDQAMMTNVQSSLV